MIFEYELLIREHHLDSYGHVNNATYLEIYEEARWEVITRRGYGYHKVHESGFGPVILEINLKFHKEVILREKVRITVEAEPFSGKVSWIRQKMYKEDGSLGSEIGLLYGFFDLKNRKIIAPSAEWLQAVGLSN